MPYVKVPEFKSNDTISADDFNEAFSSVQVVCDKLDGSNFSDESLGFDEIPDEVALTKNDHLASHRHTFSGATVNHSDGLPDPFSDFTLDLYAGRRLQDFTHPKNNNITATGLTGGEKFIIRASCRIYIPDMGARTYYDGVPAVIKVGLFQFPGEDSITSGSINANTKRLRSTEQHFRVAFSGKVPSASSGSQEAKDETGFDFEPRDRTVDLDWEYRDTRGDLDSSGKPGDKYDHHDPAQNSNKLPLGGYFSYTTCYLYEHPVIGSPNSTQSFGILCYLSGMEVGIGGSVSSDAGGSDGCVSPRPLPGSITNGSLHMYQVRR